MRVWDWVCVGLDFYFHNYQIALCFPSYLNLVVPVTALIFTRKQNPKGVINDTIVQMAYWAHAARAPPPLTRVARITLGTNVENLLSHDVVSWDVDHDVSTAYCTASLLHVIRSSDYEVSFVIKWSPGCDWYSCYCSSEWKGSLMINNLPKKNALFSLLLIN